MLGYNHVTREVEIAARNKLWLAHTLRFGGIHELSKQRCRERFSEYLNIRNDACVRAVAVVKIKTSHPHNAMNSHRNN